MVRAGQQGRVVVLHDRVTAGSPPDEQDNLVQARAVSRALRRLGFETRCVPFSHDLAACVSALDAARPAFVFNLVESLEGDGRLPYCATALLEAHGLAYTGAGTRALLCSGDKRLAKRLLRATGIPTPAMVTEASELAAWGEDDTGIVKPAFEDASIGIDAGSVVRGASRLRKLLDARRRNCGGEWFVERFVDGREFNVSLLAAQDAVDVLPVAEIEFLDFPPARARIVDYQAKWIPGSHAYTHTPRSWLEPGALRRTLEGLALACHRVLDLGAYARVDFRVDAHGRAFVLEANANPCLSDDAGFVAAAAAAGLSFDQVIARIVDARNQGRAHPPDADVALPAAG